MTKKLIALILVIFCSSIILVNKKHQTKFIAGNEESSFIAAYIDGEYSGNIPNNGARIDIRTRKITHCDIIWSNVKRRCPMVRTYKTYDEDYKKNIIKLVENGKAVSDIEREYGINRKLIYNWKNKYGTIKTSTGEVTTNDEILKLKKELNDIKIENEILKKAVAIFTKK